MKYEEKRFFFAALVVMAYFDGYPINVYGNFIILAVDIPPTPALEFPWSLRLRPRSVFKTDFHGCICFDNLKQENLPMSVKHGSALTFCEAVETELQLYNCITFYCF
jgi:hypothetical protein